MKTCPDCDKPYKGISCSCGFQERVGASTPANYSYNPPKIYQHDNTPQGRELAKESLEFVKTMLDWRGSAKDKLIFKIDYLKIMAVKYPSVAEEFYLQIREAKRDLSILTASENPPEPHQGIPYPQNK